jgi:hypothetical protein
VALVAEEQLTLKARTAPTKRAKNARKKWAELARELATLVSLKRRLAEPGQTAPTPTLLASTITF